MEVFQRNHDLQEWIKTRCELPGDRGRECRVSSVARTSAAWRQTALPWAQSHSQARRWVSTSSTAVFMSSERARSAMPQMTAFALSASSSDRTSDLSIFSGDDGQCLLDAAYQMVLHDFVSSMTIAISFSLALLRTRSVRPPPRNHRADRLAPIPLPFATPRYAGTQLVNRHSRAKLNRPIFAQPGLQCGP